MYCPECRAPVAAKARRCQRCGYDATTRRPSAASGGWPVTDPAGDETAATVDGDLPPADRAVLSPAGPPQGAARDPLPVWRTVNWMAENVMIRRRQSHSRLRAALMLVTVFAAAYGINHWLQSPGDPATAAGVETVISTGPTSSAPTATSGGSADTGSPNANAPIVAPPAPASTAAAPAVAAAVTVPVSPVGHAEALGKMTELAAAGKPEEALLLAHRSAAGLPADLRSRWEAAVKELEPKALDELLKRASSALADRRMDNVATVVGLARELRLQHPQLAQAATQAGYELWKLGDRERGANRLAEAANAYRLSLQVSDDDYFSDDVHYYLSVVLYNLGRYDEAMRHATIVVGEYPAAWWYHDDALLQVGQCLEKLGQIEKARATYSEVVSKYPNTASAEAARRRLDR